MTWEEFILQPEMKVVLNKCEGSNCDMSFIFIGVIPYKEEYTEEQKYIMSYDQIGKYCPYCGAKQKQEQVKKDES